MRTFGALLRATGDRLIVEESRRDAFRGAKPADEETLVGWNMLGCLLVMLRAEVRTGDRRSLLRVEPLDIPDFRLGGRLIGAVSGDDRRMPRPA